MYTKEQLNDLYEKIAKTIDISDELFDKAEEEYANLGSWIDAETPKYDISIYPQGSFALGTVIKPLSDEDTYDLDLVCEFEEQYTLSAEELKVDIVKPLLVKYKSTKKLEEKKRCWHIEYHDMPNFHMDIIPSINRMTYIDITDHNEDFNSYDYIGSNPKGYIKWFNSKKAERRQILLENYAMEHQIDVLEHAEIEKIKEYEVKTPLQKAIQILKRHRDIMFKDNLEVKPISIIITTISAQLYNNADNIVDTLQIILENTKAYIEQNKKNGDFYIENPSYTGEEKENFADKWNEYPERAEAFFEWLESARTIFVHSNISLLEENELLNMYGLALGDNIIKRASPISERAIKLFESKDEDVSTAIIPYKIRTIMNAPHRQKPIWGTPPKGNRIIIIAEAILPSGETIPLKSDGQILAKGTKINFSAAWGGKKERCMVRWQIVNYGVHVPAGQFRGTFESSKVGIRITEDCQYTGHHGVQCFVTQGKNKTLYKSGIFIVNVE